MKKRKVIALAMTAMMALSLAACGESGGSSGGDSSGGGSTVANKDKPLVWFNRQPSNSSTGELDKTALEFNDATYYVGFDANQGAELANLFKIIRLSTAEKIEKAVDRYLERISVPSKSLQQHHIDIMELVSALYKFALNNGIAMEELGGDMRKLYTRLLDLEPELLRNWLINISRYFSENIVSERSRSRKSFVLKVKEYVYNNYSDEELSLDKICEVLGMSNSYFSTIFKKETGHTFTTYLTDYRMNEASRLLMETNEKSYIIGKKVGYTDPNYFSYAFKRKFGVSPSKYRTEHVQGEK